MSDATCFDLLAETIVTKQFSKHTSSSGWLPYLLLPDSMDFFLRIFTYTTMNEKDFFLPLVRKQATFQLCALFDNNRIM